MIEIKTKDEVYQALDKTYEHYRVGQSVFRCWAVDTVGAGGKIFSACSVQIAGGRTQDHYFKTTGAMMHFLRRELFTPPVLCASCLRGEKKNPANYKMRGFILSRDGSRRIPYRGNLCDECCMIYTDDGAELRVVRTYTH